MSATPSTSYSVNQPNSSESEQSLSTRHANVTEPVVAKRICFYKSGDPQFNGIKMVINTRSYKTFDALLDSLSKRVPLPFGVRNISTPRGRHSITNLEDLEDGKSYICSHQRKMKPINLEQARKKPLPWQISRPISARRRAVQLAKDNEDGYGHREIKVTTPKKMLVFKNGDVRLRRTIVLGKKNTQTFEAFLDYMSELMQYPVVKLYTTDGRKVPNLQALVLCSGAVVAAGREPFKPSNYDSLGYLRPAKMLGIANRVYPKANAKSDSENTRAEMGSSSRSQIFSASSDVRSSKDNSNDNSDSSYVPDSHSVIERNQVVAAEELSMAQYQDDIEKSVHLNQDGSITVEMKVRFKIKEEETIKWTTTVSRAGLSDLKNTPICSAVMHAEDDLSNLNALECINPKDSPFLKSYNKEEGDSLQQFNAEVSDKESESDLKSGDDNIGKRKSSADLDVSNVPEDNIRPHFYRPPTPGPRRVRQKKAMVERVTLVSEKEVQEKTVGQFSYSEETQNGENKSEYCMVAQSSRKKSSVITPKFSELSSTDVVNVSSESVKEEILLKVSHKSGDFDPLETTDGKTLEGPDEDELVQNISENSAVQHSTYKSKANISSFMQSSKFCQAARPGSADHVRASCNVSKIKRSLSSFIRYSEFCQSKEETNSKTADLLPISQDSVHSDCNKASTETINPTSGLFPSVAEREDQISVRAESVTTHLNDDSQSASSVTRKKKRRKSPKLLEQNTYEIQKDEGISGITQSDRMHMTSETTQDSTTEAMGNSAKSQKKGTEFLVENSVVSVSSDRKICPEDEFYQQDSLEQNGLANKKQRSNNKKLAKVKVKSGKKRGVISPTRSEDGLMAAGLNNDSQHSQDTLSIGKEGTHLPTHSFKETPHSSVILKPLSKVPKNFNFEKEKDKNILENLSFKKEKKQKGVKKNLSKGASDLNMSKGTITLEALKRQEFQEEIVEKSLENYVQTWLKNLLPSTALPPIKKKGGTVMSSDICHFSEENTDAAIVKGRRFITNQVHRSGKNHLAEHSLTKKPLKPICDLGTLEELAKDSGEKPTDSLICSNGTTGEAAECSPEAEFHSDGKQHFFHATEDNARILSEADSPDINLRQNKKSEVAIQVDCTIVSEKMGLDVQNNCMSNTLLRELQTTLLGLQKEHNGCTAKPCSLSDLSPSALGPSSNILLAWLLVLNLSESLIGTIKDNMHKSNCSCSEILTQLQHLKQTTVAEKVDDLKAAFSHFQKSSENNLLHYGKELIKQDSKHHHENKSVSETQNGMHLHENEKSDEPCIPEHEVNSEEAPKLTCELETCFAVQKLSCGEIESLDLSTSETQLDDQSANADSNACSLASPTETPGGNEEMPDSSYEKSQSKSTDTTFTAEESESSVEPNSTIHSVTSNDKNGILDQDTSELEGEKYPACVTTDRSEDEKVDPESAVNDNELNSQQKLTAETSVEYNNEDYSVQEDKDDADSCEETSDRLSTISPLSFCYESMQLPECDMSEVEHKLQVEEVQGNTYSDASQLKKCLKSPATSDWSDYRPDTEESECHCRASSDLTNESADEAVLEKCYNTGYVKRTIERLYGKTEASFKPDFHKGFPYLSKGFQKDTEEFHSAVVEKSINFSQKSGSGSAEKLSFSSLPPQEFLVNLNKDDANSRGENATLPVSQSTLNREETSYTNDSSRESVKQHHQPSNQANEDEGILIDKGKWLLKENHLIRRSPPEQIGMYGNLDTTSTDTVLDTNSDDVPYSHFGNLNQYPVLNEISSSELEDIAKPSENFCNYFNMPHNSDSEPFRDDLSTKSKPGHNGNTTSLPVGNKDKIKTSVMTSMHLSEQNNTGFPAFTSVEFRLPDNKVHPLEHPLNEEPVQSQPTGVSNADRVRALQEEDSLDKLHAMCGQHCPILMVTVTPINEEQRGYAYQKASDIENQLGQCLLHKKNQHLQGSGEGLIIDKNNPVSLKNDCISKIANNIFNRFYANNTLDFFSNIGMLATPTLKDTSSLRKLYATEHTSKNPLGVSNGQNNASKHTASDFVRGTNSELINRKPKICQSQRASLMHTIGEKCSSLLVKPAEACSSDTVLQCDTSLNNTERNASDNVEDENAFPAEEEVAAAFCYCKTDNGNSKDEKDF